MASRSREIYKYKIQYFSHIGEGGGRRPSLQDDDGILLVVLEMQQTRL